MHRPCPFKCCNTTQNEYIKLYGIFERKKHGINISAIYKFIFKIPTPRVLAVSLPTCARDPDILQPLLYLRFCIRTIALELLLFLCVSVHKILSFYTLAQILYDTCNSKSNVLNYLCLLTFIDLLCFLVLRRIQT